MATAHDQRGRRAGRIRQRLLSNQACQHAFVERGRSARVGRVRRRLICLARDPGIGRCAPHHRGQLAAGTAGPHRWCRSPLCDPARQRLRAPCRRRRTQSPPTLQALRYAPDRYLMDSTLACAPRTSPRWPQTGPWRGTSARRNRPGCRCGRRTRQPCPPRGPPWNSPCSN